MTIDTPAPPQPHNLEYPTAVKGLTPETLCLLQQIADDPLRWDRLSTELQLTAALAVRDLYFEARQTPDEAQGRLVRSLAALVSRQGRAVVQGLSVSFHPSGQHKALRFVEATAIAPQWRPLFARPLTRLPHLAAVFADPAEFNFRTFENILPLDALLPASKEALTLTALPSPHADLFLFRLGGDPALLEALAALDHHGLYVAPLNAASRGGGRFIFHAAELSQALTKAFKPHLPDLEHELGRFSHVNPVFRCNHFEPEDPPFASHIDTPYRDPARGHISRMTMLVYLTGGQGDPALRVGDALLEDIEPMTVVLFHQKHEHEGRAYRSGPKVFLRSELIVEVKADELVHAPDAGALFAKACYLTGECVFEPELSRYAHEAYDRAAAARWHGLPSDAPSRVEAFSHKSFRGVHFVANGYDFWFNAADLSLEECATLAILDTFNCTLGDKPFRALCTTEVWERPADGAWIPIALGNLARDPDDEPLMVELDKEVLFPPPEAVNPDEEFPEELIYFDHDELYFPAQVARNKAVVELYEAAQREAKARVLPAPILLMGQEVFLDRERFIIDEGTIQVIATEPIQPLNFASYETVEVTPEDAINYDTVDVPQLLVPPLLYRRVGGCIHLMLDFFRNTWMVKHREVGANVPRVEQALWYSEEWFEEMYEDALYDRMIEDEEYLPKI
ncbi:MAG: hypothetical protein AAFX99_17355 [Myxococcota bacterium]